MIARIPQLVSEEMSVADNYTAGKWIAPSNPSGKTNRFADSGMLIKQVVLILGSVHKSRLSISPISLKSIYILLYELSRVRWGKKSDGAFFPHFMGRTTTKCYALLQLFYFWYSRGRTSVADLSPFVHYSEIFTPLPRP